MFCPSFIVRIRINLAPIDFNQFEMKSPPEVSKSASNKLPAKSSRNALAIDEILKEIGEFGLYQFLIGILIGIVLLFTTFALFNFVFSSEIPDHRFVESSSQEEPNLLYRILQAIISTILNNISLKLFSFTRIICGV